MRPKRQIRSFNDYLRTYYPVRWERMQHKEESPEEFGARLARETIVGLREALEAAIAPFLPTSAEEFAEMMRKIAEECNDPEIAHSISDELLCDILDELGYGTGVDVYRAIKKWYS